MFDSRFIVWEVNYYVQSRWQRKFWQMSRLLLRLLSVKLMMVHTHFTVIKSSPLIWHSSHPNKSEIFVKICFTDSICYNSLPTHCEYIKPQVGYRLDIGVIKIHQTIEYISFWQASPYNIWSLKRLVLHRNLIKKTSINRLTATKYFRSLLTFIYLMNIK